MKHHKQSIFGIGTFLMGFSTSIDDIHCFIIWAIGMVMAFGQFFIPDRSEKE